MIVCIAEKPSVAKQIADVIGAKSRHDGYFEGNGYQVTWTFGHLCTLKEPQDYQPRWKKWDVYDLPMIPDRSGIKLINDNGVKKQFKIIESLYSKADEIINCGDAGQEGELIQRWVMQKAKVKCPVKRLWISSLTNEAIAEGFKNIQDSDKYDNLYKAGLCRAIGDWLLGMNETRLYTMRFAQRGQILSIGRVQTPTLAMIVKRQKEIDNFKPEPYWELHTIYRNVKFSSTLGKLKSKENAETYIAKIEGQPFVVTDVSTKKGTELPPQLYDLTSLQVDCNKKFGFSADLTLKLIQSLYEKKLTTYPRVDTKYLSEDIYSKVPDIMKGLTDYQSLTAELNGKKLPKSKKVFDNKKVTDHHAIIPTGTPANNMTFDEKRVYDLVTKRFIAVFYPPCEFLSTTVNGQSSDIEFKATGKEINKLGWKIIYKDDKSNEHDNSNETNEQVTLPHFEKGETGTHVPEIVEKQTTPPKPYTEATLLQAMETAGKLVDNEELKEAMKENGIGRPSTRAAIIQTLFKRNYIKQIKKSLVATETGIQLIDTIKDDILKSPELTGRWEKKLREIERGKYDANQFMEELKDLTRQVVNNGRSIPQTQIKSETEIVTQLKKASKQRKEQKNTKSDTAKKTNKRNNKTLKPEDSIIGMKCPLCGKGTIIKGKTAFGCSDYKNCSWRLPFNNSL